MLTIPALFLLIKTWYMRMLVFILLSGYMFFKYIYFVQQQAEEYIPYVNILFQ